MKARVHVSVVIRHEDRILLVREAGASSRGRWNLPGGRHEPPETIIGAARREAREEVGVGVFPTWLVGVYTGVADPEVMSVRFVFGGHVVAGDPAPGDGILEVRWATVEEARALADDEMVAPGLLRRILDDVEAGTAWPVAVLREEVRE